MSEIKRVKRTIEDLTLILEHNIELNKRVVLMEAIEMLRDYLQTLEVEASSK